MFFFQNTSDQIPVNEIIPNVFSDLSTNLFTPSFAQGTEDVNNGSMIFGTYLGGLDSEYGEDVTTDSKDNIIVTGKTYSSGFPMLNAYDSHRSVGDAFISMFSYNGTLVWSTFL